MEAAMSTGGAGDETSHVSSTLAEVGTQQLEALGKAVGLASSETRDLIQIFARLLGSGSLRSTSDPPAYTSDVVDDHTPFEMSVAVGSNELRVLVESVDG